MSDASENENEDEGGKGLPILLAIVVIGTVIYMMVNSGDCTSTAVECRDGVPAEDTGQCRSGQKLVVESGVAVCRCN